MATVVTAIVVLAAFNPAAFDQPPLIAAKTAVTFNLAAFDLAAFVPATVVAAATVAARRCHTRHRRAAVVAVASDRTGVVAAAVVTVAFDRAKTGATTSVPSRTYFAPSSRRGLARCAPSSHRAVASLAAFRSRPRGDLGVVFRDASRP